MEITCGAETPDVLRVLPDKLSRPKGEVITSESDVPRVLDLPTTRLRCTFSLATAVSALHTAVFQIQCARAGLSLTQGLGGEPRADVPLYANINRCLIGDRSPAAFAAAATRAVREGFSIVKCAPFDEVQPPASRKDNLAAAEPGLRRVAAVRGTVGHEIGVLVDCHSRFEAHTAPVIAGRLAELDIGWFE